MRRFARRMIFWLLGLLVLAVVVPFTLPLHNGQPLLRLRDIKLPAGPHIPQLKLPDIHLPGHTATAPSPHEVTVYRWRDPHGDLHYGSSPPTDGSAYEALKVSTEGNAALFPSTPNRSTSDANSGTDNTGDNTKAKTADGKAKHDSINLGLSPTNIKKLFDDARALRDQSHRQPDPALEP